MTYHGFSPFFPFPHFLAEFSQRPQIWVSPLLEVGTAETVSCELARVFPAKEVAFLMFFGDQELSPFISWEGDTVWANATVRAMETGDQELSCRVSLGPMEQKTRELVHVYSKLPAFSLPRAGSLPPKTSTESLGDLLISAGRWETCIGMVAIPSLRPGPSYSQSDCGSSNPFLGTAT